LTTFMALKFGGENTFLRLFFMTSTLNFKLGGGSKLTDGQILHFCGER
jgi:hypothetical protein